MGTENNHYPGFNYAASQLSAFIFSIDFFIISLKTRDTISYSPKDAEGFKAWLIEHNVRDIQKNDGIPKHCRI